MLQTDALKFNNSILEVNSALNNIHSNTVTTMERNKQIQRNIVLLALARVGHDFNPSTQDAKARKTLQV